VKSLVWLGTLLKDVRSFSAELRREIGYQLYKIQEGLEPSDWKAMPSIGAGVREIRIHTKNEYRVIYVAQFGEAVYVLHAFVKKTRSTARHDLEMITERLQGLMRKRSQP